VIRHDGEKMAKFDNLLDSGKTNEAELVRAELSPIREAELDGERVHQVNIQTILNADRFVFSPFESNEITQLLKGDSQNVRVVVA
jgi:hypothetical protein